MLAKQLSPRRLLMTLAALSLSAHACAVVIVTEVEVAAELAHTPGLVTKSVNVPGAPRINIVEPAIADGAIATPFQIRVKFESEPGASLVPASLKFYYGFLKLDITDRLMAYAILNNDMLSINDAKVPAGSHRMLIRIKDTAGREAEKAISFVVAEQKP